MAHSTGPGATESTSGVGVMIQDIIPSRSLVPDLLEAWSSRIAVRHLNTGFPGGVLAVSVYGVTAIGPTGENLDLLQALGTFLQSRGEPWIVQGDWNMTPGELESVGW
eukprot:6166710-Pyramimonas_sp.AAC.1